MVGHPASGGTPDGQDINPSSAGGPKREGTCIRRCARSEDVVDEDDPSTGNGRSGRYVERTGQISQTAPPGKCRLGGCRSALDEQMTLQGQSATVGERTRDQDSLVEAALS